MEQPQQFEVQGRTQSVKLSCDNPLPGFRIEHDLRSFDVSDHVVASRNGLVHIHKRLFDGRAKCGVGIDLFYSSSIDMQRGTVYPYTRTVTLSLRATF